MCVVVHLGTDLAAMTFVANSRPAHDRAPGTRDTDGCFWCHDGNHKAKDGKVILQDCEICHDQS
jgi:hypothetical protein